MRKDNPDFYSPKLTLEMEMFAIEMWECTDTEEVEKIIKSHGSNNLVLNLTKVNDKIKSKKATEKDLEILDSKIKSGHCLEIFPDSYVCN